MSVKQVQAAGVRACFLLHFVMVVWRVVETWDDEQYWFMAFAIVPFLLESLFTVLRRDGVEWKLFSVCFFFYLGATLPGIWLLEIKRTQDYQGKNLTMVEDVNIHGVEIPIRLSPNTWVLVVEELMLYLMILGRWLLPRGEVGREQLTQLLFGFIGIASDIMELFSLFEESDSIRQSKNLTYIILGVWSLSIMQFTLTFATSHRARRARGLRMSPSARSRQSEADDEEDPKEHKRHRKSVLRVELFATVLAVFMQDGPFLAVRLFCMIEFDILTYDLVFFTAKNVLVILLLFYKFFLLSSKLCCPKRPSADDDADKHTLTRDHVHPNLDRGESLLKSAPETLSMEDPESGELRKRRGEKGEHRGKESVKYEGEKEDQESRKQAEVEREKEGQKTNKGSQEREIGAEERGKEGQESNNGDQEREKGAQEKAKTEKGDHDGEKKDNKRKKKKQDKEQEDDKKEDREQDVEMWDHQNLELGDLQKVVEGPATPAKSMTRYKKFDNQASQDSSPTQESEDASKDEEKAGEDIATQGQGLDFGRGEEDPKKDPGKEEYRGEKDDHVTKIDFGRKDPALNGSFGQKQDPEVNGSVDQKRDPAFNGSVPQKKDPVDNMTSIQKRHVSIIKVDRSSC